MTKLNRRFILRGALGITVGLPLLDCFLNDNGTALAATGAPLPVVFGTWYQELGFNPGRWVPKSVGLNYENNIELKVFDPFRDRMNIISGSQYFLDGHPLETHNTGTQIMTMGTIPAGSSSPASFDSLIADVIGSRSRFRSIEVSLNGGRGSRSKRAGATSNPSEPSPLALYKRIFGPDFKDPNAADFTPDAMVVARKSVLSYVGEHRNAVMKQFGAADKAKLDQYFTAVREIEHQLDLEMQRPAPMPSCSAADQPQEAPPSTLIDSVVTNSKLFGALLAHAVACGQTRIFNVSVGAQGLRQPGSTQTWHGWTHEEHVDEATGVQPNVTKFILTTNGCFAEFLRQLDGIKEGPSTVLDRSMVVWFTDHGYARTHTMDNIPIMTAGRAGGRLKTGMHISAQGDPATRMGLTAQQIMGVPVKSWGTLSNQTSKTYTEMLA
jgi:hypothetical protein